MRTLAFCALIASFVAPLTARADDPQIELGRRRFATGQLLYQEGHYEEALVEFEAGKATSQRPEFDYNIGQCLEKLQRPLQAADAFERFLQKRPDDPDARATRRRIALLRTRPAPPTAAPAETRREPVAKKWWLWTTVAGVLVVGGVAIGLGLGLPRDASYPATMPTDGTFRY